MGVGGGGEAVDDVEGYFFPDEAALGVEHKAEGLFRFEPEGALEEVACDLLADVRVVGQPVHDFHL